MMKPIWRLVDTGHLSAAENMAWDQALLTAQDEGEPGPVFRFLQFDPACVLVGRHQSPHQEARIDYVLKRGWHINRRITNRIRRLQLTESKQCPHRVITLSEISDHFRYIMFFSTTPRML